MAVESNEDIIPSNEGKPQNFSKEAPFEFAKPSE